MLFLNKHRIVFEILQVQFFKIRSSEKDFGKRNELGL